MELSVEQIMEHELGHSEETAELNAEAEKLIRERFSKEEFMETFYTYQYYPEGYSDERILSEIIQDARAGINNFGRNLAQYKETVREVYDRARENAVSREANGERETRGPSFSRESEEEKETEYEVEKQFTGDLYHDANVVYAEAKKVQKELNDTMREITERIGTKAKYQDSTQKSIRSMISKIVRKGGQDKYPLLKMKDHTRTKIELDSFEQIQDVLDALDEKNIPYQTENVRNEWGYNGFHVTWRNPNGITSELQLTTPEIWKLKLWSDGIYDKWRNFEIESASMDEIAEYKKAKRESQDRWGKAGVPDLAIYERASSSERMRPSVVSQQYNSLVKGPQRPSENSIGREVKSFTSSKMSLPDSVRMNMQSSPSNTIIDENYMKIKEKTEGKEGTERWSRGGENLLEDEAETVGQLTETEAEIIENASAAMEEENRQTLMNGAYRYDMVLGQKGDKIRAAFITSSARSLFSFLCCPNNRAVVE